MLKTLLVLLERGAHGEDGPPVLDRLDPPGREAAAIANAIDIIDDVVVWIAREQEVTMQRMHGAVFINGLAGGGKRLAQHLPAVHALPADAGPWSAEQVVLQPLQSQGRDERL